MLTAKMETSICTVFSTFYRTNNFMPSFGVRNQFSNNHKGFVFSSTDFWQPANKDSIIMQTCLWHISAFDGHLDFIIDKFLIAATFNMWNVCAVDKGVMDLVVAHSPPMWEDWGSS
jgi:hypothetical protein